MTSQRNNTSSFGRRVTKRLGRVLAWALLPAAAYLAGQSLVHHGPPTPSVVLKRVGSWDHFGAYPLEFPTGVAALPGGGVAITDRASNRVFVVGSDGRLVATAGGVGEAPGRFRMPFCVAADRTGIYVADCLNNRIQVFDSRLRLRRIIDPGIFQPAGVLPDGRGGCWISAGEFSGVEYPLLHVDANGRGIGMAGLSLAGFPSRGPSGRIWFANRDARTDPVMVFGPDGGLRQQWGGADPELVEQVAPDQAHVFVGDRRDPRILIFNKRGQLQGAAGPDLLRGPAGIAAGPYGMAVDSQGYLWACLMDAHCVARYRVVNRP